ncbi:hypothetical protein [Sphingobacterium spiritivorum]
MYKLTKYKFGFYLLILFLGFNIQASHSQTMSQVSGLVMEKGTGTRLSDVNVTNLRTRRVGITNNFGVFNIDASIGDSLYFSKIGYGSVKTILYSKDDILIDMQAGIKLETVIVERMTKEAEMNSIMRDYEKKGIYNGGKNKTMTYLASPATALYNLFGREAKNAKRFQGYMDREIEEAKVDRVFTRSTVTNITALQGEDLESFMSIYRPSPDMVQHWGQYDIMNYVKKSFEKFEKDGRPKPERLPKLAIPPQEK